MKGDFIVFKAFLLLCLISTVGFSKEIVLQNGLDGYQGCGDTWVLQYAKEGLVMQEYMPDRFDVYSDTCLA